MSMPTTDYNQLLLCYLQNWRQLLEQWAAMAAGSPLLTAPPTLPTGPAGGQNMAPFLPFMPPLPPIPMGPPAAAGSPVPPAPADYTQQLFSYLQAWRQYLEQLAAASPAWPSAVPAGDGGGPNRPPNGPIPPENSGGSTGFPQSDATKRSDPIPPKLIERPPFRSDQTQIAAPNFDPLATPFDRPGERFDRPGEQFQMADPAILAARPRAPISEATTRPEAGSAFLRTMTSVGPTVSPQPAPKSLFANPGAQTLSEGFREAGERPSP